MNTWLLLLAAIVSEVIGTLNLKLSNGLSETVPTALVVLFYAVSFYFLSLTLKEIDVEVAYAVWAGLGTALIATLGVVIFKDPVSIEKVASIALIIVGVVGLHLSGSIH